MITAEAGKIIWFKFCKTGGMKGEGYPPLLEGEVGSLDCSG
jgi:hypothetical protein